MTIADQGAALPTSDIILQNMQVVRPTASDGWTQAQWVARRRSGFRQVGSAGDGTNGEPNTTCVSMTGSHIQNVRFGAEVMRQQLVVLQQ